MEYSIFQPSIWWVLWVVPLGLILFAVVVPLFRTDNVLAHGMAESAGRKHRGAKWWLVFAFMGLVMLLTPMFAGQKWTGKLQESSCVMMIAFDVSESMDAQDVDASTGQVVSESRIQTAKSDLIDATKTVSGCENVGLISFGGTAQVVESPTTDTKKLADSINGLSINPGGTASGEAISLATDICRYVSGLNEGTPCTIFLVSDGFERAGDGQRAVSDALSAAVQQKVVINTVHYGSEIGVLPGARIVRDDNPEALQSLATETNGKYFSGVSEKGELAAAFTNVSVATRDVPFEWTNPLLLIIVLMSIFGLAFLMSVLQLRDS